MSRDLELSRLGQTLSRVLVVDDNEQMCSLMGRILRSECELHMAGNGDLALELINKIRPDLILLDINLPGMSGYDLCEHIRSSRTMGLTKIVLVSGNNSLEERLHGYDVGADDYITKPFDNDELKAKVKVFLRLKRTEEVDRLKTDLIELFGHETRTHLAGIIGLSEAMEASNEIPPRMKLSAQLIHHSGERLLEFVRKTTLFSQLNRGIQLKREPGSLLAHLQTAVDRLTKEANDKSVTVTVKVMDDYTIKADWGMLRDVMGYLVDNAIKYSPHGGQVSISVAYENRRCRIAVTDHGEGVHPDWHTKIFDPFTVRDLDHHQQGQGLSLSIARRVANLHGGDVTVDSALGQGAIFTLDFVG